MPKKSKGTALPDGTVLIGCCGAYCRTCRSFILGSCKGCKTGYEEGARDIKKAICKVKRCCIGTMRLETCADCRRFDRCTVLADFHGKNWPSYLRYRRALELIRADGYEEFIGRAKDWKRQYGEFGPETRSPKASKRKCTRERAK